MPQRPDHKTKKMEEPYRKEENPEAWTAWQCLSRTCVNVFLTGRAGTGKTTFLKRLKEHSPKRMVVVAPTGVAAINAGGVTIHSFFQLPFSPYIPGTQPKKDFKIRKQKLYIIRTMDLLVIDEISMVRADLLDAIDAQLRLLRRSQRPFGGVQLLLIGDLQQLAPVVQDAEVSILSEHYSTFYFFGSQALRRTQYLTVELQKVYRQSDPAFVSLLNKVRDNRMDAQSLALLNSRYKENFRPSDDERYIRLTTHNSQADSVNQLNLSMLGGTAKTYDCETVNKFPEAMYPGEAHLTLKVGAQVMFIKNDRQSEKRFFNGKIGVVSELKAKSVIVSCSDSNGDIEVGYDEWQNVSYTVDSSTNEIVENVEGVFRQIPLRLAWAITIHKSQGLTFDHAIIDAANSFSHGQVYVALSRCRTFEGMVLSSKIPQSAIIPDAQIANFIREQSANVVTDESIELFAMEYSYTVLAELFNFDNITTPTFRLLSILQEHYAKTYPKLIKDIEARLTMSQNEIDAVGHKFIELCVSKKAQGVNPQSDPQFSLRIVNGAKYFLTKLSSTIETIASECDIALDNQTVNKQYHLALGHLKEELKLKKTMLKTISEEGFSAQNVAKAKAQALSEDVPTSAHSDGMHAGGPKSAVADVRNPELFKMLDEWRKQMAEEQNIGTASVISTQGLISIANEVPTTIAELRTLPRVGTIKVRRYGNLILQIVSAYKKSMGLPELSIPAGPETDVVGEPDAEQDGKEPTHEISLRLFNKLHNVEAVAQERGLKAATIKGHLFKAVSEGLLDIDEVLPPTRRERLRTLLEKTDPEDKEYGKALVQMGFDYSEIRYVKAQMAAEKEE